MKAWVNKRFKLARNQKGMTLIELLAVVVILGILAAVAGAAVVNGFDKSKTNADATSVRVIQDATQRYVMDNNVVDANLSTITLKSLIDNGYLQTEPTSQVDSTKKYFSVSVTRDATSKLLKIDVTTAAAKQQ